MTSFDQLPMVRDQRLAVRVTPAAQRELRRGHPWLFDGGITSDTSSGRAGDLAVVFDQKRAFLAIGLYDPDSPIRVRILHHGQSKPIDRAFWRATFDRAVDRRRSLTEREGDRLTSGFRLLNGENDGVPGLIVDRYDSTLVVKLYSAAWIPHLRVVVPELVSACAAAGITIDTIVFRLARTVQRGDTHGLFDGQVVSVALDPTGGVGTSASPLVEPVLFHENGLRFEAYPVSGQKTGHFLDQRDNRQAVRARAAGARVLDVFACTGGFSVYAAAGGARSVHSVDLAPEAIATARRNMAHNARLTGSCVHTTAVVDAFEAMAAMADRGERFDLVVVDPPSFAHKRGDVGRALAAYRRLTQLALPLIEPGGLLVQASCSSRIGAAEFSAVVSDAASDAGYTLGDIVETGHAVDHPVSFAEGAYLKAVFARVGSRPAP